MQDFPVWETGTRETYPPLRGTVQADVAIVGGGLTGATCAAMLSAMGVNTVLLEAHMLGRGASWNCTGKVTSQLGGIYQTIADKAGLSAAATYVRLMREAVWGVRNLCLQLQIPTQAQNVYVFAETEDDLPALRSLQQLEGKLGLPVSEAPDAGGCPFPVELSIVMHDQLLLQPLPYLLALIRFGCQHGLRVYEHTPAQSIDDRVITTPRGVVEAETILLATGSPVGCTSLPRLTMMQQRRCQTVVLRGGAPQHHSHLSVQGDELTLRPLPDGVLLAWDLGRAGQRDLGRSLILDRTLHALLPDMQVVESHVRQDVWSGDGLPLIGPVKASRSHLLMATGYSGWGICGSFLAARTLAGYVTGRPMEGTRLFRPDRPAPHLAEGLRTAGAYLGGLARRNAPTCPHMGGKLRYNPDAQRWECPCHGSAFSQLGHALHAPALHDARVSQHQR